MRYLVSLLLCAFLVGCVPYSDNPLTDPDKQPIDTSIYGTWFWTDDNESGYIHFGLDAKTKLLTVAMVEFYRDGELRVSQLSGHTSLVNGNNYLNLKWVIPANETPGYLFVKYEVKADALEIQLIDPETVGTAIKDGLLKGEVTGENWFSSIHITESQEKLQKFVVEKDKALFENKSILHRLTLPKIEPRGAR
jgi:hypothetical protein